MIQAIASASNEIVALVVGVAVGAVAVILRNTFVFPSYKRDVPVPTHGDPQDKTKLVKFPNPFPDVVSSASPACAKVEAFLKLAGIPFTLEENPDPSGAPRQKLPYICHGKDQVPDSALIINYLINTYLPEGSTHLGDVRVKLTEDEETTTRLLVNLLDTSMYNSVILLRWVGEDYQLVRDGMLGSIPAPIRGVVMRMLRVDMARWLWGCGVSRFSDAEVVEQLKADIDVVSRVLGNKPFVHGNDITVADIALFGFMDGMLNAPFKTAGCKLYALQHKNLVDHHRRIARKAFGI